VWCDAQYIGHRTTEFSTKIFRDLKIFPFAAYARWKKIASQVHVASYEMD
jgi:hypothetical protein